MNAPNVGDTVRHRQAGPDGMTGVVLRVRPGSWSNGNVPMVTVAWDARTVKRHTATQLVPVTP